MRQLRQVGIVSGDLPDVPQSCQVACRASKSEFTPRVEVTIFLTICDICPILELVVPNGSLPDKRHNAANLCTLTRESRLQSFWRP